MKCDFLPTHSSMPKELLSVYPLGQAQFGKEIREEG